MDFGESEIVQILHDHAVGCAENGHLGCRSTLRCQKLAAEYAAKVAADVRARTFDIQVAEAPWLDRQPSIDTPVAALMRIVQRNLTVGPFGYDNFRRSVRTTTALARLGELNIPPDAVVRTGLRQRIIQSIILKTTASWWSERANPVLRQSTAPGFLRAWHHLIDSHLGTVQNYRGPEEAWAHASASTLVAAVDEWLRTTAMAHVIDWRYEGQKTISLTADDLNVLGGVEPTYWLVDRFATTELGSWRKESLNWELAFLRSPEEISRRVGVSLSVLKQRPASIDLVTDVIANRLIEPRGHDRVALGMTEAEIIDRLALLLGVGDTTTALSLVRTAMANASTKSLQMALGFCLIPVDPAECRSPRSN